MDQVLVEISPDPVAAASLGQVYRGRLRDGGAQVAVKVQRPKVLASIGLDLFVMRNVAAAIQRIPSVRCKLAPLYLLIDARNLHMLHQNIICRV